MSLHHERDYSRYVPTIPASRMKPTHHVIPKGLGYIIERRKNGERWVLNFHGEEFKFANRANAEAYAAECDKDTDFTRNDQWLPVLTRYQGGSNAPSLWHKH